MAGQARGVIKDGLDQGPTDTDFSRSKSETETDCCPRVGSGVSWKGVVKRRGACWVRWEKNVLKWTGWQVQSCAYPKNNYIVHLNGVWLASERLQK